MAGLRKLATTCPNFQDPQTNSTVSVKLASGPALGEDALTFTLDSPDWAADDALEAIRVGNAVVTVLYSATSGTGTTEATTLATLITKNIKGRA